MWESLALLHFLVFYFKLFANLPEGYAWLKYAAFALLFNMFLGIADITMPLLWIPILLAIHFSSNKMQTRKAPNGSDLALVETQYQILRKTTDPQKSGVSIRSSGLFSRNS